MTKQSYKLTNTKISNHTHRNSTPHRVAKKDRKLKTEHAINKRLHLAYVFQNEIEKNRNYHLLDSIHGLTMKKKDVLDYIYCLTEGYVRFDTESVKSSFYKFDGKNKYEIEEIYNNKSLDKQEEAVYIKNILKKIGGKKNDKKRISC